MRDDFSEEVKRTLAARVNYFCSNPDCRAQTTGPQVDPSKVLNVGVAAHITAASDGGPRYDVALTSEERRTLGNGIWLCQNCAKIIDNDILRFTAELLRAWKTVAEDRARIAIGKTSRDIDAVVAPRLELYLEFLRIDRDIDSPREPARYFILGIKNGESCGTAKFPGIRYRRSCGLVVNRFGINGSFGFGLPQSPSESEWEAFRGGSDQVVHPGETLKITQLLQGGRNLDGVRQPFPIVRSIDSRWRFDSVKFQCEISAEGIARVSAEKSFTEQTVTWRM